MFSPADQGGWNIEGARQCCVQRFFCGAGGRDGFRLSEAFGGIDRAVTVELQQTLDFVSFASPPLTPFYSHLALGYCAVRMLMVGAEFDVQRIRSGRSAVEASDQGFLSTSLYCLDANVSLKRFQSMDVSDCHPEESDLPYRASHDSHRRSTGALPREDYTIQIWTANKAS